MEEDQATHDPASDSCYLKLGRVAKTGTDGISVNLLVQLGGDVTACFISSLTYFQIKEEDKSKNNHFLNRLLKSFKEIMIGIV